MNNIEIKNGESVNITASSVSPANIQIAAGVSSGGEDLHYTHTQSAASSTWNVAHNLDKKPSVTIVDSADTVLHGSIEYTDNNNLVITLSAPTSGKAYIN